MNDVDQRNQELLAASRAVKRRAFEEHVAALIERLAPLAERAEVEATGMALYPKIVGVELEGSYPETVVRIHHISSSGERRSSVYPIWDSDYQLSDGKMRDPEFIAGEVARYARGG